MPADAKALGRYQEARPPIMQICASSSLSLVADALLAAGALRINISAASYDYEIKFRHIIHCENITPSRIKVQAFWKYYFIFRSRDEILCRTGVTILRLSRYPQGSVKQLAYPVRGMRTELPCVGQEPWSQYPTVVLQDAGCRKRSPRIQTAPYIAPEPLWQPF
jgi:hypothetical protein